MVIKFKILWRRVNIQRMREKTTKVSSFMQYLFLFSRFELSSVQCKLEPSKIYYVVFQNFKFNNVEVPLTTIYFGIWTLFDMVSFKKLHKQGSSTIRIYQVFILQKTISQSFLPYLRTKANLSQDNFDMLLLMTDEQKT